MSKEDFDALYSASLVRSSLNSEKNKYTAWLSEAVYQSVLSSTFKHVHYPMIFKFMDRLLLHRNIHMPNDVICIDEKNNLMIDLEEGKKLEQIWKSNGMRYIYDLNCHPKHGRSIISFLEEYPRYLTDNCFIKKLFKKKDILNYIKDKIQTQK